MRRRQHGARPLGLGRRRWARAAACSPDRPPGAQHPFPGGLPSLLDGHTSKPGPPCGPLARGEELAGRTRGGEGERKGEGRGGPRALLIARCSDAGPLGAHIHRQRSPRLNPRGNRPFPQHRLVPVWPVRPHRRGGGFCHPLDGPQHAGGHPLQRRPRANHKHRHDRRGVLRDWCAPLATFLSVSLRPPLPVPLPPPCPFPSSCGCSFGRPEQLLHATAQALQTGRSCSSPLTLGGTSQDG